MSVAAADRVTTRHDNQPPLAERLALDYSDLADEVGVLAQEASDLNKPIKDDKGLGAVGAVVKKARDLAKRGDDARKREKEPFLTAGREVDAFFGFLTDRLDKIVKGLGKIATDYQREKEAKARAEREAEVARLRAEEARRLEAAAAEAARNRPKAAAKQAVAASQVAARIDEAEAEAAAPAPELTRVRTESGLATTTTKLAAEIVEYETMDLNELRWHFAREDVEKALRHYVKVHRDTRPLKGVRIYQETKATFR